MNNKLMDIIGHAYNSVIEPSCWHCFLSELVILTNSLSGVLVSGDTNDMSKDIYASYNIDPFWVKAYNDYYFQFDPSITLFTEKPGKLIPDHVTGSDRRQLKGDVRTFYHELMVHQDYYHTAGIGLALPNGQHFGLILTRAQRQGQYDHNVLTKIEIIASHARRAIGLQRMLSGHIEVKHSLGSLFDTAGIGVIMLGKHGQLLFFNQKTETLLQGCSVLCLTGGRVSAVNQRQEQHLQELIATSSKSSSGAGAATVGSMDLWSCDGKRLSITISPFRIDDVEESPFNNQVTTIIFVQDPEDRPSFSIKWMKESYGLTQAEAILLKYLSAGMSIREISERLSKTEATLRSQLKSLMKKTTKKRQSELVELVHNSPIRYLDR